MKVCKIRNCFLNVFRRKFFVVCILSVTFCYCEPDLLQVPENWLVNRCTGSDHRSLADSRDPVIGSDKVVVLYLVLHPDVSSSHLFFFVMTTTPFFVKSPFHGWICHVVSLVRNLSGKAQIDILTFS